MWLIWAILDSRRERADAERSADQLALAGLAKGDETALAGLYDRHATGVYSLALRILQDVGDAEDIVQEVFTQAWRQASRYDARRGAVAAWLLTMARTRAIDRLRARRIRTQDVIDDAVADVSDPLALPDAVLVSGEQVTRVRAALSQLPILQRAALELAYYEGLTHAEIAAAAGGAAGNGEDPNPVSDDQTARRARGGQVMAGPTDHNTLHELSGLYVLGSLSREDRAMFETHLAGCAACADEVRSLTRVSGALAQLPPQIPPSPALRQRVLASVGGLGGTAGPAVAAPSRGFGGWSWLAAAASLVLAVGLGAYATQLRSRIGSPRKSTPRGDTAR